MKTLDLLRPDDGVGDNVDDDRSLGTVDEVLGS